MNFQTCVALIELGINQVMAVFQAVKNVFLFVNAARYMRNL